MPRNCSKEGTGGKGNRGKVLEREHRICAAGLPTAQPEECVGDALQYYLLKDEVDALISDVIVLPKPPHRLPPLRHPSPPDQRHAGPFSELAELVNPPNKTKFQLLVEDLRRTPYKSYWKSYLGQVPDPVPMFPRGHDIERTTYGKNTPYQGNLYDLVMPKDPIPDQTPKSKQAGVQMKRNYCQPAFNPDLTYGYRTNIDPRGVYVKCALTDETVIEGTAKRAVNNSIQADFEDKSKAKPGIPLTPNDNSSCVPEGYRFGKLTRRENLPQCLTLCELNPGRAFYMKCLTHLNSLRKTLSTRYLPTFIRKSFVDLKYYDSKKSGWLDKKVIYDYCATKMIRFDPKLIEPLLCLWDAFDGSRIEYKTFTHILNFKEPLPTLPKIPEYMDDTCLHFETTYGEMTKPGQDNGQRRMAGVPSGRYLDLDYPITPEGCCRAHSSCLPHESDMKSCLEPSVWTLLHVNHRDIYAKREPHVVRRVFEATGEKLTDEKFGAVWEEAKKYHSQGWVCYETFRKALENCDKSQTGC